MRMRTIVVLILSCLLLVPAQARCATKKDDAAKEKPKKKAVKKGRWWMGGLEEATEEARLLGKPILILVRGKGARYKGAAGSGSGYWRKMKELKYFVCVELDSHKGMFEISKRTIEGKGGEGGKLTSPMLYMETCDQEFLGKFTYEIADKEALEIVRAAVKEAGPQLKKSDALRLWRSLAKARKQWEDEKYGPAMKDYRDIKKFEEVNPKLPIFQELKKDTPAIEKQGKEDIKKAREYLEAGDKQKAEKLAKSIKTLYKGFEAAELAESLLEEINPKKQEDK